MILYYLASVLSLLGISYVIHLTGENNLPPLIPAVRYTVLALYANLGLAYILLLKGKLPSWIWVGVIGSVLCFMYPVFSGDLMEYLIRGRMLSIYHVSPYVALPTDFPNDLLRPYSVWLTNPDSYGPLSVYIQTIPTLIFQHSITGMIWFYKMIVLGFVALAVYYFRKLAPNHWAIFAFSPLLIVGAFIDGHNDIIMMALSIMSIYYLFKRRYMRTFVFWTLAFLVKYMVIIILPFIVIKAIRDGANIKWPLLASLGLVVLLFCPIWGGTDTFLAIWKQRGAFYTNSFPYVVHQGLHLVGLRLSELSIRILAYTSFFICYIILLVRCWMKPSEFYRILTLAYFIFYITLMSPFGYWYLFWALPWLVLCGWNRNFFIVLLYSTLGLLAFYKRINYLLVIALCAYTLTRIYDTLLNPQSYLRGRSSKE